MADNVALIEPQKIDRNPENPRLIFRDEDMQPLQASISLQGILVPLSVYQQGKRFVLLDGERRWRCATKLGLESVPVIIQPEPDRLQNIMMMFAIHNARRDWDPLPTAMKLRQLEEEFKRLQGRPPKEVELAELASLRRGEVRRLKNLLRLPESYLDELMAELELPRSQQLITVDHVLETMRGVEALRRRNIVNDKEVDPLRRAILDKFRAKTINNTVAPRRLSRIARAVEREEIPAQVARDAALRLIEDPEFSIDDAFEATVEQADFEHTLEQSAGRLADKLREHEERRYDFGEGLRGSLMELQRLIRRLLS